MNLADRVLETTTTTGTGALTLAGAIAGFRTFNSGLGVNNTTLICIEAVDASGVPTGEWEVCSGTLTGATTLTRNTIMASSNAGAAVNFSAGTKRVFCGVPAQYLERLFMIDLNKVPAGVRWGLTLSNNTTDATNDIDIAAGSARDADRVSLMFLANPITKRLDAAWAAGTNQGGLDAGSIANDWYHVWLIGSSILLSDGFTDVLFSASATAPTMPTGYDVKCRIGAILRASNTIVPFVQRSDHFMWVTPRLDVDVSNQGTSATARTLSVPDGVMVLAQLNTNAGNVSAPVNVYVRQSDQADQAPSTTASPLATIRGSTTGQVSASYIVVRTDTNGQVTTRADAASTFVRLCTLGWIDPRGGS